MYGAEDCFCLLNQYSVFYSPRALYTSIFHTFTHHYIFITVGVLRALNRLIEAVNIETRRCEATNEALSRLTRLIEECELCRGNQHRLPTCATHPITCAPGVSCIDTASGPRCGPCPRGYTGDGRLICP